MHIHYDATYLLLMEESMCICLYVYQKRRKEIHREREA